MNECFIIVYMFKREFESVWGRGGESGWFVESMFCFESCKWIVMYV